MKPLLLGIAVTLLLANCRSGVNYSKALFEHVPTDPEVLVVVRPSDIITFSDRSLADLDLVELFGENSVFGNFKMDTAQLTKYRDLGLKVLDQSGIPMEQVETFGYMSYLSQHVFMISGEFTKAQVEAKLSELGFKQDSNGYFEYIYGDQMINLPTDGLILYALPEMLEDLSMLPDEKQLWNRKDFKDYRENSPLGNSVFVWSHPPERFLSDFQFREDLGDVSLAVNLRDNITARTNIRIKDPQKTVALFNIVSGAVTMGKGFLGDDPELGPVLQGITVSQDNQEVVANMVIQDEQFRAVRDRLIRESKGGEGTTFAKINNFFNNFN